MTITQNQAEALSAYLQRIDFHGHIFDPNDHDESVHLIPIPSSQPFWVFSFKPSVSPRVINGGNMFTYGVAADSFDAIVLKLADWDWETVMQGMKTLKVGGLVFLCVPREVRAGDRAIFARLKVSFVEAIETHGESVMVGRYKGGI